MSDADEYATSVRIPVERQAAMAWLRHRLWWDARLAELEAAPASEQEPSVAAESRGAA